MRMEITVKLFIIGILSFKISICAAYYNEYTIEDLCKDGNETIIYETDKMGVGTLRATSHLHYKSDKNCTIIIQPPADQGIVLSVRKIDMRKWGYSCLDYIKVYHSDRYTSPTEICNFVFDIEEKNSFYTKGPMTIVYHVSPASFPAFTFEEGFTLTYTVVSDDLQDCLKDNIFRCNNGRCIPNDLTCDGRNNCGDRSDESHSACDANPMNYIQKMDKVYIAIFSILIVCIVVSTIVFVTRRRGRTFVDSNTPYILHSKAVHSELRSTDPYYPQGMPVAPPPYSQ